MDHSEALRLQAVEKYVLGELSPELREQYEEHYFECEECATDVKAVAAFTGGAREMFRQERGQQGKGRVQVKGWFGWLRPAIAAPALAALLLIVCYQRFIAIPKLQRDAAAPMAAQNADLISLIGANSRGEGDRIFQIHRDRPTILDVDIPASGFTSYVWQIQTASGRTIYENRISAADAKSTVHLILPKDALKPGQCRLAIFGERGSTSKTSSQNEVERLSFSLEMVP